jgi:hypothetical protein
VVRNLLVPVACFQSHVGQVVRGTSLRDLVPRTSPCPWYGFQSVLVRTTHLKDIIMTTIEETAAEFLRSRAAWLRVETVDRPGGGWDVVLCIDGTYYVNNFFSDDDWADMVRSFQEWLVRVFHTEGIPFDRLQDWAAVENEVVR